MQLSLPLPESSPPVVMESRKRKTNYSYETSLPAYKSNTEGKVTQAEKILATVKQLKQTCLKQLSDVLGIDQSTVSGRIGDLIEEGRVKYADKENYITYGGRLRKKILICE